MLGRLGRRREFEAMFNVGMRSRQPHSMPFFYRIMGTEETQQFSLTWALAGTLSVLSSSSFKIWNTVCGFWFRRIRLGLTEQFTPKETESTESCLPHIWHHRQDWSRLFLCLPPCDLLRSPGFILKRELGSYSSFGNFVLNKSVCFGSLEVEVHPLQEFKESWTLKSLVTLNMAKSPCVHTSCLAWWL